MRCSPHAVLIDLDGTLADSLGVMRLAYETFLLEHNCDPTNAEFESLNGPPMEEIVRLLKLAHSIQENHGVLLSRYLDLLDRAYLRVRPSVGAAELLKTAKAHKCIVGIVTSNNRKRTQLWLENVGLRSMVDFIVSADDVKQGKPHPEPYKTAIKQKWLEPQNVVAIEDSPQGAASSVGAGLKTFVLGYKEGQQWPQGVVPISSLTELIELLWVTQ